MKVVLETDGGYDNIDSAIGKSFNAYPVINRPDLIQIKCSDLYEREPVYHDIHENGCLAFNLKYDCRVVEL